MMSFDYNKLSLVDLISERHAQLRKLVEERWNSQCEVHFSHSEWHLMAKVAQQSISISQAANIVGISRQAMQKIVRKLEDQGVLVVKYKLGNKRDKYLSLTPQGERFCEQIDRLKQGLERELAEQLGAQEIAKLRSLFSEDWLTNAMDS